MEGGKTEVLGKGEQLSLHCHTRVAELCTESSGQPLDTLRETEYDHTHLN